MTNYFVYNKIYHKVKIEGKTIIKPRYNRIVVDKI